VARRSGLGRGLGSLIPPEVGANSESVLRDVPVSAIRPNPLQPRTHFDEESMAALATSIREVGVLQPILVRELGPDDYELIAGERRWRAARRAGLQTMPVLVQHASDVYSLEQALIENLHREDLNALEEAGAYQQLIDQFDYTHERVASRMGKSRTAVTNTLRLLQLPAGVQRVLAEGSISAGHARALLGTPDRALQEALAKRVISEGLTVRATEDLVRQRAQLGSDDDLGPEEIEESRSGSDPSPIPAGPVARPEGPGRRLPVPGLLELEELLAAYLNTRVTVDMGSKHGRLIVEFATLEDLERIYKLMVGSDSPG
jgi:ParB family transcriptional regulator, chromosome partitioning protein